MAKRFLEQVTKPLATSHSRQTAPLRPRRTLKPERPAVTEFYIRLSRRLRNAKLIFAAILVLFSLTVITCSRDRITLENFRYLFRYFDIDASSGIQGVRRISYNADSNLTIAEYRGDIAIGRSNAVTIKSQSGSTVLDHSNNILTPTLLPSSKYLLAYDLGGNQYAVYNTFSLLHTETLENTISTAANSNTGLYAIVTSGKEYRSVIHLYDSNFRQILRISKDKLVMDLSFSDDGKHLMIVSVYAKNGSFCTEVMVVDPYSDTEETTTVLEDTFPLRGQWNQNGGFSLLTDSGLRIYDAAYRNIAVYAYRKTPASFYTDQSYFVIVSGENVVGSSYLVQICDTTGKTIFSGSVDGKIIASRITESYVYVLTSTSLNRINLQEKQLQSVSTESGSCVDLLSFGENLLFLCYPTEAVAVNVDTLFENTAAVSGQENEDALQSKPIEETTPVSDTTETPYDSDTADTTAFTDDPSDTVSEDTENVSSQTDDTTME